MRELNQPALRTAVSYGIAFGMLLCACSFAVDSLMTAIWGHRIPLSAPPILAAAYLLAGIAAGGFVGAIAQQRATNAPREVSTDELRSRVRGALSSAAVVTFAAIFVERIRLGYEGYATEQLGTIPIIAGLIAAGVAITTGWKTKHNTLDPESRRDTGVWPAVSAAFLCGLWEPFGHLYQAPMLSQKSLTANGAYLIAGLIVYLLGRAPARWVWASTRLRSRRACLAATLSTVALGLVLSSGFLLFDAPQPVDRKQRRQMAGVPGSVKPHRPTPETSDPRPNVILIVLDTVRADHLSVYGYDRDTTPNLADFARTAVRYDQAVAPSSWTSPSHASILTGLLPSDHGVHNLLDAKEGWWMGTLDERHVTIAEILSQAGYNTGAVVGNSACLSREFGMHQGFDYYDDKPKPTLAAARPKILTPAAWLSNRYRRFVPDWWKGWSRNAEEVNADVLAWLDRGVGSPFFLFINYLDAHAPYHRHPEFEHSLRRRPQTTSTVAADLPVGRPFVAGSDAGAQATGHEIPPTQHLDVLHYDQEIAYTDRQIGKLFADLKARGAYDNALIIVTADHGESFGEHGNFGHGNSLYQEESRVPLIVRYPTQTTRGASGEPTSLTAIPSIILNHLGLPFDAPTHSSRGLQSAPTEVHSAIDSAYAPESAMPWSIFGELYRAELIHPEDDHGPVLRVLFGPERLKALVDSTLDPELYDFTADPRERRDIACDRPGRMLTAVETVDAWMDYLASQHTDSNRSFTMSEELRKRLESLGYLK